jgi:hypothetical protein
MPPCYASSQPASIAAAVNQRHAWIVLFPPTRRYGAGFGPEKSDGCRFLAVSGKWRGQSCYCGGSAFWLWPRDPSSTEYVDVTVWEDLEPIRAFAGERWQEAVITPDEEHLLRDTQISHYEVLLTPA